MAASILQKRELEYFIGSFELVPSSGGVFEFEMNSDLLFSKKTLKRHAEEGEILSVVTQRIEAYKQENNIYWETQED